MCGEFFKMRVLGYADDGDMLDRDTHVLTIRLTTLADAAKHETDILYGSFDAQDLLPARRQEDEHQCRKQQQQRKRPSNISATSVSEDSSHTETCSYTEIIVYISTTPPMRHLWSRISWEFSAELRLCKIRRV